MYKGGSDCRSQRTQSSIKACTMLHAMTLRGRKNNKRQTYWWHSCMLCTCYMELIWWLHLPCNSVNFHLFPWFVVPGRESFSRKPAVVESTKQCPTHACSMRQLHATHYIATNQFVHSNAHITVSGSMMSTKCWIAWAGTMLQLYTNIQSHHMQRWIKLSTSSSKHLPYVIFIFSLLAMFPAVVIAALPHLDIMEKRELYGYVLNGVPASVVLLCMWGFAFRRALAFQESWWQVRMHSCVCSFQTLVIHDRSQGAHRAISCFGIFCWCACNRICFLKAWTPHHGIRHSTRSFSWFEPMCWSHDGPHQCSSFAVWESSSFRSGVHKFLLDQFSNPWKIHEFPTWWCSKAVCPGRNGFGIFHSYLYDIYPRDLCVCHQYIVHREKPRLLFVGLRGYVDVSPQWSSLATATLFIIQQFNGGSSGFPKCKPATNLATWMSQVWLIWAC